MKKYAPINRGNVTPKPKPPDQCPVCGSVDIKRDRPTQGENECRTCGHVHDNKGKVVTS